MKKLLFFLLIALSFEAYSQQTSTIYFISKYYKHGFVVSIYLNDQLAGTIKSGENLEYKLRSEGRITVAVTGGAGSHVLQFIDVKKGGTYYCLISYISGVGGRLENLEKIDGMDLLAKNLTTIKAEESKRRPLLEPKEEEEKEESKQGTCFVINNQGYLLTNYHVISGAKSVKIKGIGGDYTTPQGAEVVAFDVDLDLALLKLQDKTIKFDSIPYSFGAENNQQGVETFVLGYPLTNSMGNEIKISEGIISSNSGYKGSISQYQFSAPVQPGNSGSPLFNNKGELLGIINAKLSGAEGAGYAVKAQYIPVFLKLIENVQVASGKSKLSTMTLPEKVAKLKGYVFIVVTE